MTVQRRADELARYVAELGRRVEVGGVRNLSELADLAGRLQRALESVAPQEITWAIEQAQALEQELRTLAQTLETVATLKRRMDPGGSPPA